MALNDPFQLLLETWPIPTHFDQKSTYLHLQETIVQQMEFSPNYLGQEIQGLIHTRWHWLVLIISSRPNILR